MNSINERVHTLYWEKDVNCARTMLICLGELFHLKYEPQVLSAALGLHGAGGFRGQCGLVEGGLMFIGIYYKQLGKTDAEIVAACYEYAKAFQQNFTSLQCYDLRPHGFTPQDPPHMCEQLTGKAVNFAYTFIRQTRQ